VKCQFLSVLLSTSSTPEQCRFFKRAYWYYQAKTSYDSFAINEKQNEKEVKTYHGGGAQSFSLK
jgi:hypothetical protein